MCVLSVTCNTGSIKKSIQITHLRKAEHLLTSVKEFNEKITLNNAMGYERADAH